jgi:thiol-disulfide isomerase/thioredoxin
LRHALVGLLASFLLCTTAGPVLGKAKAREPAPRFNATTTRGEKFNNESLKGKVVLLEFWTTWCGFCLQEAGFVDRINDAYANKGLVILAINVGESRKTVKKYLEQHPRSTGEQRGAAGEGALRELLASGGLDDEDDDKDDDGK